MADEVADEERCSSDEAVYESSKAEIARLREQVQRVSEEKDELGRLAYSADALKDKGERWFDTERAARIVAEKALDDMGKARATLEQERAVVEAVGVALSGGEPSDFMLSFPIVRQAFDWVSLSSDNKEERK